MRKIKLECPNCGERMIVRASTNGVCEYKQNKHGYISGCGYRAAYNKYWKICPYCGNNIAIIDVRSK